MLTIGRAGVDVIARGGALGGVRGGLRGGGPGGQRALHPGGPHRRARHVHQRHRAALHHDPDDGPVDGPLGELLERPAGRARRGHRHADLGEQLVGFQHGLEQALEEVGGRDLPGAGRPAGHQRGIERQDCGGQVGRGVAVRQRPADRAPVPDLRVADLARGVREQRQGPGQHVGVLEVVVAGQRPDRDVPVLLAHVAELLDRPEVDEHLRHGQPQLHERQQRVTAGQELGVVAVLTGKIKSFRNGSRATVAERCRDHRAISPGAEPSPSSAAARTARTMLW